MTGDAMDPRHRELLDEARRIAPDSVKVEFSGDTIVLQESPSNIHQLNLSVVRRQLDAHAPEGYVETGNTDLYSPGSAKLRNPDIAYLPYAVMAEPGNEVPAELALIAVEIVSPSNPENDWVGKLRDYPLMGIPIYLIVDARECTVTLFSEPNHDRYHTRTDRKFGETIRILDPFGFELDTTGLVPY